MTDKYRVAARTYTVGRKGHNMSSPGAEQGNEAIVEVRDLVKIYPGDIRAIDDISFQVGRGEIFGFLGPNGAGKTTTIRAIVTLLKPTSGEILVDGFDAARSPQAVRERVGYAAQFIGVDDDLTAHENLVLQARLHNIPTREAKKKADELLEITDLRDAAKRRAGTFSGGMRRRLDLAQALVHEPRLLFLDEPTTGLDPQNRRALWRHLRELNASGLAIFLTTQYMEEANTLCERLAIIDQGRIQVEGTPAELKAAVGGEAITITLPEETQQDVFEQTQDLLGGIPGAGETKSYNHSVSVFLEDGSSRLAEVVRTLDRAEVPVTRLELAQPTLDDVFLQHTGERLRVEETKRPAMRRRHGGRKQR